MFKIVHSRWVGGKNWVNLFNIVVEWPIIYLILFVASAHFFDVVLNPRHRGGHCKSKRLILNSKEMYNNICFSSLVQCAKRGPKIEQN